jgi:hypothetical protein
VLKQKFFEADGVALDVYDRVFGGGANHAYALNIAVSVWFCRFPGADASRVRRRVSRLLDARAAAA